MVAAVTDYNTLNDDLKALLVANVVDGDSNSPDDIQIEANDFQRQLMKHRQLNIRLTETDDRVRVGQSYYTTLTYEIDVAVYDLARFNDAAIIRNDLVRSIKITLRDNAKFSGVIDATRTVGTAFGDADAEKGFIAAAIVTVEFDTYENA